MVPDSEGWMGGHVRYLMHFYSTLLPAVRDGKRQVMCLSQFTQSVSVPGR